MRHNLAAEDVFLMRINYQNLERTKLWNVLGIKFNEHLKWNSHLGDVIRSCYAVLADLQQLKSSGQKRSMPPIPALYCMMIFGTFLVVDNFLTSTVAAPAKDGEPVLPGLPCGLVSPFSPQEHCLKHEKNAE